jgi:CheY-like chemotaxis protein
MEMDKKTILLVEDDIIVRQSLKVMLENSCGYEVIETPNGASAIAILSKQKPAINAAILDIMMIAGHGGSVGDYLKKTPPYDTILIIYYTGLNKTQFDNKILEGALYVNKQTGGLKKIEEILKEQLG